MDWTKFFIGFTSNLMQIKIKNKESEKLHTKPTVSITEEEEKQTYHPDFLFFVRYARQDSPKNISVITHELVSPKFYKLVYLQKHI